MDEFDYDSPCFGVSPQQGGNEETELEVRSSCKTQYAPLVHQPGPLPTQMSYRQRMRAARCPGSPLQVLSSFVPLGATASSPRARANALEHHSSSPHPEILALPLPPQPRDKAVVKNRRLAYLEQLERTGFFTEEEMRSRRDTHAVLSYRPRALHRKRRGRLRCQGLAG